MVDVTSLGVPLGGANEVHARCSSCGIWLDGTVSLYLGSGMQEPTFLLVLYL